MAAIGAKPPFVLHQPRHQHPDRTEQHEEHPHQARLPVIPDLRFEHSYLRSISRYITVRRRQPLERVRVEREYHDDGFERVEREKVEEFKPSTLSNVSSEVIDIQWSRVAWITTRDQVISPLLQGALWALASYFLTPFSAQLGTQIGSFARTRLSPSKEGAGVGWLRGWVSGLGLGSSTTSQAPRQS
ncbi:hypothetical protein FPV67DRAFT_1105488 [Lyophyllum atratum]|nr:hypothetical protein FPV67DRAFT_1105488 [Lyophyllum atratum]